MKSVVALAHPLLKGGGFRKRGNAFNRVQ